MRLNEQELLQLKQDKYNMEQFLIYVKRLEKGYKLINDYIHKSNTDKNWYAIQDIVDKIMEYI